MGIHGLSSFFNQNPNLSERKNLHDTKLVIDGSNLVYMLYLSSNLECVYGGDYDRYAATIQEYFARFAACNIDVILVFDGGYDISECKLKTCQQRLQQRFSAAKSIAKTGTASCKILPILAHEVFKDVARELGIPIMQCQFEADEEIVAIANHFGCPVASQDSDFYIFDIKAGFIRLDSIADSVSTCTVNNAEFSCLACQWYQIENLLCYFPGFNLSLLPLFGTLLGNDFVSSSMFDNFCSRIKLPKQRSSRRGLNISKRHTKMIGLFHWLSSVDSKNAIDEVLNTLKGDKREEAMKIITDMAVHYAGRQSPFVEHLIGKSKLTFSYASGVPFPCWLTEMLFEGTLNPYIINVAVVQRVFQLTQVDCFDMQSSYSCSLSLRKALYGIILGSDSERKNGSATVVEFDREGSNMKKFSVEPCFDIPGYGQVPKLADIPAMNLELRQKLLRCILECEVTYLECTESVHLTLLVIQYWLKKSTMLINENVLRSLLLSLVVLRLIRKVRKLSKRSKRLAESAHNKVACQQALDLSVVLNDVSSMQTGICGSAARKFLKYFSHPVHNNARRFDSVLVHSYSQLQTCLLFTRYLNRILLKPYVDTEFHYAFNGTFLYNFTKELDSRPNPDLFISECLGRGSSLDIAFSNLYKMIRETVSGKCFVVQSTMRKQRSNKKASFKQEVSTGTTKEASPRRDWQKTSASGSGDSVVSLSNRFRDLL